jgi:3-oxoacyl-[acyl-carrier-protein] synthase III
VGETDVFLCGPRYCLGEAETDHTALDDLSDKVERFGLMPDPGLWGWGSVFRTERDLETMAVETGTQTLRATGTEPSDIDALVLCSTFVPGPPEGHGGFVRTVLTGIGLGDIPVYGMNLNRCVNLLAALDVATAFIAAGRYRQILVVTTDRVVDEANRITSYALFSDGAASCVVAAAPHGHDGYQILSCATAQRTESLDWSSELSSDLSRQVNDSLLSPLGLTLPAVSGLMHTNIFKPVLVMKERQAGFTLDQLYTENITRIGHCFAADPLINLVDRAELGQVRPEGHYLLAASIPGSRIGVLLKRLPGEHRTTGRATNA